MQVTLLDTMTNFLQKVKIFIEINQTAKKGQNNYEKEIAISKNKREAIWRTIYLAIEIIVKEKYITSTITFQLQTKLHFLF